MPPTDKEMETYVQIWSKVVDTQMHFNEMCVKSRQFGLAFVTATLGLGVVLLSREGDFSLTLALIGFQITIHVSVFIVVAAAFALVAVQMLDLNVYHKMLRGAVTFGEDFEENYMKQIFDLDKGMTQAISHFSRHQDAAAKITAGKYEYTGKDRQNAEVRIRKFYKVAFRSLLGVAVALFIMTNLGQETQPVHSSAEDQSVGAQETD